ncbi:MAG: efflux RND transporter periplasmic adaptor subunit [Anaerolineae bacterium]
MKNKQTWIVIGLLLVVCAAGAFVVSRVLMSRSAAQALADVETGQVTRATLSSAVESSGSVAAQDSVALSFGTSGTAARVVVEAGDRVKRGDVLAALDTADLELQVAQAEQAYLIQQANYSTTVAADPAAVASAQAAVSSANAATVAAKQKYDLSADQITVGCASLENAKDALENAQKAYDNLLNFWKTRDYAPYSPQKAQLDTAQNNYNVALANCNITTSGINDGAVRSALAQLEQAKQTLENLTHPRTEKVEIARAQLEQSRISLEQARLRLANAQIVAPFDGVVTKVNVKVGEPSGATPAIEIADVSGYHVNVLIDEIEIALVQAGQTVEVTLDALPGVTLSGAVARIDPAGTISQGVVNYNVRVDLDPTDAALRLDMTANVRILGETHADVLAVPTAAVRSDAEGAYVMTISQSGPKRVPVTIGLSDGDLTEVTGELREGQPVFIGEPPRLGFGPFGGQGGPPSGFPGGQDGPGQP